MIVWNHHPQSFSSVNNTWACDSMFVAATISPNHTFSLFPLAAINAGKLLSYWNLPHFSYSSTDPELADKTIYSTMVRTVSPFNNLADALVHVYQHFGVSASYEES